VTDVQNNLLMSQLKWPIETLFVGLRPALNVDNTNNATNTPRDWHRLTSLTNQTTSSVVRSSPKLSLLSVPTQANLIDQPVLSEVDRCTYALSQKTVQSLKITAHGINIYDDFSSTFFNAYTPYHYGGWNIVTPEDEGAMMVNFCLYPGTYQPSGHLNISRAREFYVQYTAPNNTVVSPANPADLLTLAIAINFLLISDGSAVLRYST
jgi:hypothetical protein